MPAPRAPSKKSPVAPSPPTTGVSPFVHSVGIAFAVFEEITSAGEAIGVSDLARRLGETKARMHRHLATLRELGYIEKDPDSDGYRPGWKTYKLGMAVAENFGLRRMARRHLLRLHHDTSQTVALAIPAGRDISVIDEIQSTAHVAITIRPGSVIPSVSSALGRAILAFQPAAVRAAALAVPISALTGNTLQDPKVVERRLEEIARLWYEIAVNERLEGISALAAPIFDEGNRVVASIGVIGSQGVVTRPPSTTLVAKVQDAAARISAELRSTAWTDVAKAAKTARATQTKRPHK